LLSLLLNEFVGFQLDCFHLLTVLEALESWKRGRGRVCCPLTHHKNDLKVR